MFIFLINDKPVIKIVQYGIIFLTLVFLFLLNKIKIFVILINLKLIQGLNNSVHCIQSYTKIYLMYIHQILKTSMISYV